MEELDLKEIINIFWNKKFQIILIIAIFAVIGIVYTIGFVTPMYTSSTRLLLVSSTNTEADDKAITSTDLTLNSKLVSTYRELIKGKDILREVIANLGITIDEESLKNNVTVSLVEDTELIEIAVTNENPTYAAQIANEIANVFPEKVKELYKINNVQIIGKAEVSTEPSNINHPKDVLIFAFFGFIVAVAYVLIANILDTTIKTIEDVEKGFGIPVLVSIPMIENFENERGGKK